MVAEKIPLTRESKNSRFGKILRSVAAASQNLSRGVIIFYVVNARRKASDLKNTPAIYPNL
jgi:hypothetical protein